MAWTVTANNVGDLGSGYEVDFAGTSQEIWIVGTLNSDCAITFANAAPPCRALIFVTSASGKRLTIGGTLVLAPRSDSNWPCVFEALFVPGSFEPVLRGGLAQATDAALVEPMS
jgi:hypothetical protein